MLSIDEESIAKIFDNKNMERDTFIGFLSILRKFDACKEMLKWLDDNKEATIDDIRDKVIEIYHSNVE